MEVKEEEWLSCLSNYLMESNANVNELGELASDMAVQHGGLGSFILRS